MPGLDTMLAARCRRGALAALTVLAVAAACTTDEPPRDSETGELLEPTDIDVFQVQVGDCLDGFADNAEISTVRAVPCSIEHTDEVIAEIRIPDTDEFPGHDAIGQLANEECYAEFTAFVGLPWEDSELDYAYLAPTEDSWGQGDRQILCLVSDPAGPTTGTLEDADR